MADYSSRLHTSDSSWTASEMSDVFQEHQSNAQIIEPTSSDENVPQRCSYVGCSEQHLFSTRAALKRHQDKHIRPYICHHVSCHHKSFGDKGGLERHKREVHRSQAYKCPVPSCKRNKHGFHRRYNLFEHQKRAHRTDPPSSFLRACSDTVDEVVSEAEGRTPRLRCEDGVEAREVGLKDAMDSDSNLNGELDFRTKLRNLRIQRAELDENIRSMERALSIMGGASP